MNKFIGLTKRKIKLPYPPPEFIIEATMIIIHNRGSKGWRDALCECKRNIIGEKWDEPVPRLFTRMHLL